MSKPFPKWKILELLLKYYLKQHGYQIVPEHIQNYYNVTKKQNGLNVKGRGTWHQIDALGQFSYRIPFIYPLRLLSEVKYRDPKYKKISLGIVRDFVGVMKDMKQISLEKFVKINQSVENVSKQLSGWQKSQK